MKRNQYLYMCGEHQLHGRLPTTSHAENQDNGAIAVTHYVQGFIERQGAIRRGEMGLDWIVVWLLLLLLYIIFSYC